MILKQAAIKCDGCGVSQKCSIIKCLKAYGKKCLLCGHEPLMDEKDVAVIVMVVLFSFFLSPVDWIYRKITGAKPTYCRLESDDGKSYKLKEWDGTP